MSLRTILLALGAACCLPALLPAQSVPSVSAELTLGKGRRPTQAGEVWYLTPAQEAYARAGIAIRLGSPGRVRPVLNADYSFKVRGDQLSICGVAPNGSCRQYFPDTDGYAAGLGVRGVLLPRLTMGVGAGLARYATTARFVEADAAVGLGRHLHLVAHARRLLWRDPAGARLWLHPVTVGLRVQ